MRKKLRLVTGIVSALLVATVLVSCDDDDIIGLDEPEFRATLSGASEVPPTTSTGTGFATFEDEGSHFEFTLSVTGLTQVNAAHIHGPAAVGANAGVIINLFIPNNPTGPVNGVIATGIISDASPNPSFTVSALRTMFNNGTAYVNVHTTPLPNGAIRGQIVVDD
jgi:hypothetical protein